LIIITTSIRCREDDDAYFTKLDLYVFYVIVIIAIILTGKKDKMGTYANENFEKWKSTFLILLPGL
jgi:hypothetical protein